MLLQKNEEDNILVDYEMKENGNYNDEDIVGQAHIKLNNKEINKVDIYLDTNNNKNVKKEKNWFLKLIDFIIFWR